MSGKIEISRDALTVAMRLVVRELETLANDSAIKRHTDALEELRAMLAAPVVERQPVAWLVRGKLSGHIEPAEPNEKASNPERWTDAFPVYTSPPAPVADDMVRLLTRARIYARDEFRDEIDACLDKVKELNQ